MCKTRFSEIVSKLEKGKSVEVETNSVYWEISLHSTGEDFKGIVYRLSKLKKEDIQTYQNSKKFYERIASIARNGGLQLIDNQPN